MSIVARAPRFLRSVMFSLVLAAPAAAQAPSRWEEWPDALPGVAGAAEPLASAYDPIRVGPAYGERWQQSAPAPAPAEEKRWEKKELRFEITPYFYASRLDGTVGTRNVNANVDQSFWDLVGNLESAFMMNAEIGIGRVIVLADAMYYKLGDEEAGSWSGPGGIGTVTGNLDASLSQTIYEAAVGYRLRDAADSFDLLVGARYTEIRSELSLATGGGQLPGGTSSLSEKEGWLDPIVGVRWITPVAERFQWLTYLDIGGFGLGSTWTSQFSTGAIWQFTDALSAKIGLRWLYQDYENDGFTWDVGISGVYFGLGIRF